MAEVKYISKDTKSNKMWSYEIMNNTTVVWRFGRIGGHITEKSESFSDNYSMMKKINSKVAEKTAEVAGKCYKLVDEAKYEEEKQVAEDIGIKNKIIKTSFVEKNGKRLKQLDKYDPTHWVHVQVLDSWSKKVTDLLLSKNESFEIVGLSSNMQYSSLVSPDADFVDGVRRYIRRLADKVRQIVTVAFAALGSRKLDLGGNSKDEDDFVAPEVNADFLGKVGESGGASDDVIRTFAALGARKLDL